VPPRIVQWLPVETFDEVIVVARSGHHDQFVRTATAGGLPVEELVAHVSVRGAQLAVGEPRTFARLRDPSIEEAARALALLAELIEPTRLLVRDLDGTRALHADREIAVLEIDDWHAHLVAEGRDVLAEAAVREAIDYRGETPEPEPPDPIEQGIALLDAGRLDDAWTVLAPREDALQLFLAARALSFAGFVDDSRVLLRAALESVSSLTIKAHPDARVQTLWWTEKHPELAALVAEIKAKRGA